MSKIGRIDISKLSFPPERHEYETAKFFTRLGYDVIFIRLSLRKMESCLTLREDFDSILVRVA